MLDISEDKSTGFSVKLVGIKDESLILKICHWQSWEGKLIWGKKRIPVLMDWICGGRLERLLVVEREDWAQDRGLEFCRTGEDVKSWVDKQMRKLQKKIYGRLGDGDYRLIKCSVSINKKCRRMCIICTILRYSFMIIVLVQK